MSNSVPEWVKDAVFYQIFPDRFAQCERVDKEGMHFEPWDSAPTVYGFKGGDLLGAAERLDYLQDLGITAVYFNPVFSSASNHRYHTYDYYTVDPLLGGNAALKEFIEEAHQRGMRVILDGVFNHASRGFWQFHHVLESAGDSPYVDWFYFKPDRLLRQHHWGAYPNHDEQYALRQGASSYDALGYQGWWNLPALPKFNTNTPAVRTFLWDVAEYWIKFGIDGWRLDVPGEINDDAFWQEFRRRVKSANPDAYIVGEIWDEGQRWLQGDQFDAVMNYLLTGALLGFLIGEKIDKTMAQVGDYGKYLRPFDAAGFADRVDYLFGLYGPEVNQVQLNLLDSHDTPRFLTAAHGDLSTLQLAWLVLFTFPGAPCIYYGDEIGMEGGRDPDCRRAFNWDDTTWNKPLFDYLKNLTALRKAHPALRRGEYVRLFAEGGSYAFSRKLDGDNLVVVINASDQVQSCNLPVGSLDTEGSKVTVLLGKVKSADFKNQSQRIELAPRSGCVLKG